MRFNTNTVLFTQTMGELFETYGVKMSIARLDLLHPVVSGNKLFKLHYFLEAAVATAYKTILTFGGAYSNHLVATAFACNELGLKSIGIVRGEAAPVLSATLQQCRQYGMDLHFITRNDYKNAQQPGFAEILKQQFGNFTLVPEGGYSPVGAAGAALIMDAINARSFTHVCTAVGTATTLAGLLMGSTREQEIIAVPVVKNMVDLPERISFLSGEKMPANLHLLNSYHFGGYAQKTGDLLKFMNDLYEQYALPTDFIYTAKMLYAVFDQVKKGYFKAGSDIVCLHTGGLQGNVSLKPGTLIF